MLNKLRAGTETLLLWFIPLSQERIQADEVIAMLDQEHLGPCFWVKALVSFRAAGLSLGLDGGSGQHARPWKESSGADNHSACRRRSREREGPGMLPSL